MMDSMEQGLGNLNDEQRSKLRLFHEVTGSTSDDSTALGVLRSCNWNVEQAVQLALAGGSFDQGRQPTAAPPAVTSPRGDLGAPLLRPGVGNARGLEPASGGHGGGGRTFGSGGGDIDDGRSGFRAWLRRSLRRIGDLVFDLFRTFFFGAGAVAGGSWFGGASSGTAFRQALTSAYGNQLQLPRFYDGSFSEALQVARSDLKLLVIFLHSSGSPHNQAFCTNVLANESLRAMLDASFVLWGGDMSSPQVRSVARIANCAEYPSFSVLLPASVDDIQLIGVVSGNVEVDSAVALLTACLDDLETHRSSMIARREQHAEDRQLRQEQDREYQEALEMDRRRAEEQAQQERERREQERLEEEKRQQEKEEADRLEAERLRREEELRRRARELVAASPTDEATQRISLRLPAGQRIERRFCPTATLADVYAWAEVAPFMPENEQKGLVVPEKFVLKSSFPSRELTERERTVSDLQLGGTNILLAAIEDDDEE